MTQNELERKVISLMLEKDNKFVYVPMKKLFPSKYKWIDEDDFDSILEQLKSQYDSAEINKREFSGVGFITTFQVPDKFVVNNVSGEIMDVFASNENNPDENIMFVLFITEGRINCLEGVSIFDWDNNYESLNINYTDEGFRKIDIHL